MGEGGLVGNGAQWGIVCLRCRKWRERDSGWGSIVVRWLEFMLVSGLCDVGWWFKELVIMMTLELLYCSRPFS